MSQFRLGRFVVNRLGYGAMRLVGPGAFGPPSDPPEAARRSPCADEVKKSARPSWMSRSESPSSVTIWADRKSTRLNSSHVAISYAVFCLKKKKQIKKQR